MKTKRIMALLMAMVMMLGLCVTAGAEELTPADDYDVYDHQITYHTNWGTDEVILVYCTEDNLIELADGNMVIVIGDSVADPVRKNYVFDGWYTEPVGGTLVAPEYVMKNYTLTLYAHWSKAKGKSTKAPGRIRISN